MKTIDIQNLEAIIFDLGGVIINIDYNLTVKAFEKIGFTDFNQQYSQAKQSGLFDLLETGKIQPKQFVNELKLKTPIQITDQQTIDAWNALLQDFPKERLELLKRLNKKFNTFLLSNTNQIHLESFNKILEKTHGLSSLKNQNFFKEVYYSHEIQLRKPHTEVFEYVIKKNKLNPSKTLFIDDSIQHIEGANKTGLQTYWMQKGDDILNLFSEY